MSLPTTEEKDIPDVELLMRFSGRKFQELVQYPVIVECWSRKEGGKGKREWEKEFTEEERALVTTFHEHFHRWHLKTGTPLRVQCKLPNITLLQRACNFFARI